MECQLTVTLKSDTPVVGCEINPSVRVTTEGYKKPPPHSLAFSWYREHIRCSFHRWKLAEFQCMSCVTLNLPLEESYHCSTRCFFKSWKKHVARHCDAAETVSKTSPGNQQPIRTLRSCGSWPAFGESAMVVEQEGEVWCEVGSSKTYTPTKDDFGFRLKLESVALDCSQATYLSPINVTVTEPVIIPPDPQPRCMIQIGSLQKSRKLNCKAQFSNDVNFSVLSYNILSDMYAEMDRYSYCPTWALAWEYRQQNLLQEITEYDADILCLQEVQSDHFENFFEPQLTKCGYSVMYKKKNKEIYTGEQLKIDGCATFYRSCRFKEIMKYELDFNKTALSVVEALEPELRNKGRIRLMKDNVALVVILETLRKGSTSDVCQSRICVANTHIHANPKFPDAKLCQVANLVNGLEKIAESQVPILICGDMNSLPESDPHLLVVRGRVDPSHENTTDPLGIYQHLKLHHSLAMVSAYASFCQPDRVQEQHKMKMNPETHEPLYTHFSRTFSGTLDYIFYTADSLVVEGLLELVDHESIDVGLPSPLWSSDHVALMARFRLKRPSSWGPTPPPLPPNPWDQAPPLPPNPWDQAPPLPHHFLQTHGIKHHHFGQNKS